MTQYPLDHGPADHSGNNRDRKVQAEAEAALRSSFEIHGKSSINAANEDLTLNPIPAVSRTRPLTPDLYAGADVTDDEPSDDDDFFETERGSSAIDDVVSSGTWQTSSYLGPKRTALDDLTGEEREEAPAPLDTLRADLGRTALRSNLGRRESSAGPIAMAIGAAGAGFLLARIIANHRNA